MYFKSLEQLRNMKAPPCNSCLGLQRLPRETPYKRELYH
jgi:hypothetical protein